MSVRQIEIADDRCIIIARVENICWSAWFNKYSKKEYSEEEQSLIFSGQPTIEPP